MGFGGCPLCTNVWVTGTTDGSGTGIQLMYVAPTAPSCYQYWEAIVSGCGSGYVLLELSGANWVIHAHDGSTGYADYIGPLAASCPLGTYTRTAMTDGSSPTCTGWPASITVTTACATTTTTSTTTSTTTTVCHGICEFLWTGSAWVIYFNTCDGGAACCLPVPTDPGTFVGQTVTTDCSTRGTTSTTTSTTTTFATTSTSSTTTSTTTTTLPLICATCEYVWRQALGEWILNFNNCTLGCHCNVPTVSGAYDGQVVYTNCSGPTSTTTSTTTTAASWYWWNWEGDPGGLCATSSPGGSYTSAAGPYVDCAACHAAQPSTPPC